MKVNQEEILWWYLYAKEFKDLVRDFMTKNNIGEKKAKGQVYDFIIYIYLFIYCEAIILPTINHQKRIILAK